MTARGRSDSGGSAFFWVIVQIIVIDIVFSLDSIITAIGMAQDIEIMIAAVVIACLIMYISSGPVARFVAEHPTTKMLALAFLVLIGVALVADGFKFHIPRGYIYFAIAFSAAVEFFNVLAKSNRKKASKPSGLAVPAGVELTRRALCLSLALEKRRSGDDQSRPCAQGRRPRGRWSMRASTSRRRDLARCASASMRSA